MTLSTTHDYENLYLLDVLGLDNTSNVDQYTVYRIPRATPTKPKRLVSNHPNFYNNRKEGLACFSNLLSELQHDVVLFKEYVDKIEKQLVKEVVKKAHAAMIWKRFYVSYKPVVKQ